MRRALATIALGVTAAVAVGGCGDGTGGGPGKAQSPPRPRVSAAATLEPDGTVPWVDEPAVDADFAGPTRPPAPATGPACHASQLKGALDRWIRKSTNGEVNDPVMDASLYGFAVLTNTSRTACTLHGVPDVRLAAGGKALPLGQGSSTGEDAVVGLPPGGKAHFRLDWGAPFCTESDGGYSLVADISGTGDVPVRLADQAAPGCAHDDTHPELRSFLTPGPVTDGDVQPSAPATSPLSVLTARPGDIPTHVRPGQTVDFTVTLTNPTAKPVSLAGRPGFALFVLCTGGSGEQGLSSERTYLLNNRPVHAVPAHGSVRFAIRATVPRADAFPGPRVEISWRMRAQGLPSNLPSALVTIQTGA